MPYGQCRADTPRQGYSAGAGDGGYNRSYLQAHDHNSPYSHCGKVAHGPYHEQRAHASFEEGVWVRDTTCSNAVTSTRKTETKDTKSFSITWKCISFILFPRIPEHYVHSNKTSDFKIRTAPSSSTDMTSDERKCFVSTLVTNDFSL